MFKMSPAVAALIVAGLVSLACSDRSGLRSGGSTAGAGGVATGGRTGDGLAGGAGGTLGPGGAGGASTGGAGSGITGGAISTGGSTGTGDASACLDSTVTFQVNRAPGNATAWCLGQPGSCSSNWLIISSQLGDLTLSGMCRTPCDTCQFMACPIVCAPAQELTTAGATQTWNGTYYLSDTCGAQSRACLSPQCAPAGRFAAHICGFPNPAPEASYGCGQSTSSTNTTCVDVPFDYPSSTPIVVTLPPQ